MKEQRISTTKRARIKKERFLIMMFVVLWVSSQMSPISSIASALTINNQQRAPPFPDFTPKEDLFLSIHDNKSYKIIKPWPKPKECHFNKMQINRKCFWKRNWWIILIGLFVPVQTIRIIFCMRDRND